MSHKYETAKETDDENEEPDDEDEDDDEDAVLCFISCSFFLFCIVSFVVYLPRLFVLVASVFVLPTDQPAKSCCITITSSRGCFLTLGLYAHLEQKRASLSSSSSDGGVATPLTSWHGFWVASSWSGVDPKMTVTSPSSFAIIPKSP